MNDSTKINRRQLQDGQAAATRLADDSFEK
jgi:hypothetical protein